jgi:hypothetical protein
MRAWVAVGLAMKIKNMRKASFAGTRGVSGYWKK